MSSLIQQSREFAETGLNQGSVKFLIGPRATRLRFWSMSEH